MWPSEDIIFVGGECDQVKTLFLLVENATKWRSYSCWWRMRPSEHIIFVSDHLDPFHPVQEPNNKYIHVWVCEEK